MRWATALLLASLTACGGAPLLHGLPRPNTTAVAGIAAAVATAATVANPAAAGRLQEQGKTPEREHEDGQREMVPVEVLDRIDQEEAQEGAASAPASAPAARPAAP